MSFGLSQITATTPTWAKWMFRITFILTTAITMWVAGTGLIPDPLKIEIMLILKAGDAVIFGFSKLFGIELKKDESQP